MNQQPDKIFRDKLSGYQRSAPHTAWDKIAASQPQKKPISIWWKIAASFLIATTTATVWIIVAQHKTSAEQMAKVVETVTEPVAQESAAPSTTQVPPDKKGDQAIANGTTSAPYDTTAEHQPQTLKPEKKKATGKPALADGYAARKTSPASTPIVHTDALSKDQTAVNNDSYIADHSASSAPAAPLEIPGNPIAEAPKKNVKLVYSAADVASYLNKISDDEATDDDQKQSTLKKLLHKANDLTTNQDPFAELRQRKNEILALNFKNDKRGQKTSN